MAPVQSPTNFQYVCFMKKSPFCRSCIEKRLPCFRQINRSKTAFCEMYRCLVSFNCVCRTFICTRTAGNACILCNFILVSTLGDCAYRTCTLTAAAAQTCVCNLICHFHFTSARETLLLAEWEALRRNGPHSEAAGGIPLLPLL